MNIKLITEKLKSPEYDFLKTDPHLGDHIILLGLGGSHAYGTNIETSDLDIRGCAVNRKAEENIKGIQFAWKEVFGFCNECGKEIFLPEIYDQNLEKLDKEFWKHYNEEKKRENKKEN